MNLSRRVFSHIYEQKSPQEIDKHVAQVTSLLKKTIGNSVEAASALPFMITIFHIPANDMEGSSFPVASMDHSIHKITLKPKYASYKERVAKFARKFGYEVE